MESKKFECENGWVVVISDLKGSVTQVHSTGLVSSGRDDRAFGVDYFNAVERDLMDNALHTQQAGKCGVRWPEEG